MVSAGQDTIPLTLDPPAADAADNIDDTDDTDDMVARPSGGSGPSLATMPPFVAAPVAAATGRCAALSRR
jgi:hypothetical protein